jgi:hypothetical protein
LVVGIDVEAPQRAIVAAVEKLVAQKKKELGVRERRRRHELLGPYLKVWDLREGWTGAGYDTEREVLFPEIAKHLRMSRRTAVNHYQSAFRFLSGHQYSFENWFRLFRGLKLTELRGGVRALKRRRPSRDPHVAEAPAGTSEPAEMAPEMALAYEHWLDSDDPEIRELIGDIQSLMKSGCTDDKILEKLDLRPELAEVLRVLRPRLA